MRADGSGRSEPRGVVNRRHEVQRISAPTAGTVINSWARSSWRARDTTTRLRLLEFFAVTIRNPHTRRAHARAAGDFLAWCEAHGVVCLVGVQPLHFGAWIEALGRQMSALNVKLQLAGVRRLFD